MTSRNRTPIILGIIAGVLAIAVGITLTMALTRGTPAAEETTPADQPATGQQTSTEPDPTPSDTETTPVAATGLTLSATGFTLTDDAGDALLDYTWSGDAEAAVTALAAAFGAPPTERTEAGNGSTYPDYTVYQWSGFALYNMVPLSGGPSRDDYSQPSYVRVTANEVAGVPVTLEFGVTIGMPISALEALSPDVTQERGSGTRFVFAADRSSVSGGTPSYSMIVDTDGSTVTAVMYFYFSG